MTPGRKLPSLLLVGFIGATPALAEKQYSYIAVAVDTTTGHFSIKKSAYSEVARKQALDDCGPARCEILEVTANRCLILVSFPHPRIAKTLFSMMAADDRDTVEQDDGQALCVDLKDLTKCKVAYKGCP